MNNEKPLSNLILFVSLGIIFWFIALLFIRFAGDHLFVNGNPWLILFFILSIPIAWVLVKIGAIIGKVEGEKLLIATVLMSLTALLLDGVALTWFQNWYGLEPAQLLLAAAWLLWGVGVGLMIGYWESHSYNAS
ncbi:DUF5367 family protein [Anabaena sp. PCC 7108]|uniref:DUF5367 family protein n=1 Tax=Anabaena sp. PCC 7108 TaxID=163908 RepID=UPI0003642680|nr:DUF5367 family protein [Anabaena sp. PCC 7108]